MKDSSSVGLSFSALRSSFKESRLFSILERRKYEKSIFRATESGYFFAPFMYKFFAYEMSKAGLSRLVT